MNTTTQGYNMKKYLPIIISLILIFACSDPGASDLELAKSYMSGDSLTAPDTVLAVAHFTAAAGAGNAEAMYYLGYYSQHGIGMEKNTEQALSWYERSASAGFPQAQNKMGMVYYTGSGAEQDYEKALSWFTKSARNGYDQAQYMLGKVYSLGRGVEPDTAKAIKWLKKGVKGGHPYPEFLLGKLLYETGNTEEAYEWVKKSADKGVGHARELLEEIDESNK